MDLSPKNIISQIGAFPQYLGNQISQRLTGPDVLPNYLTPKAMSTFYNPDNFKPVLNPDGSVSAFPRNNPAPQAQNPQSPPTSSISDSVNQRINNIQSTTSSSKPYYNLVTKMFPTDSERMYKTVGGESSYNPRLVHFNDSQPGQSDSMLIPDNFTKQQWQQLRQAHPNMDVGLAQINTDKAGAMADYLQSKGLTFYDLLDPEKNLQIASDLYYGKIPGKAPGIGNWVAAQGMGFK